MPCSGSFWEKLSMRARARARSPRTSLRRGSGCSQLPRDIFTEHQHGREQALDYPTARRYLCGAGRDGHGEVR